MSQVWPPRPGARVPFAPEWSNLVLGAGSTNGFVTEAGSVWSATVQATLGAGFSVGAVQLTLPVATEDGTGVVPVGQVIVRRGTTIHVGTARLVSPTTVALLMPDPSVGYGGTIPLGASVPWGWSAGDVIGVTLSGIRSA